MSPLDMSGIGTGDSAPLSLIAALVLAVGALAAVVGYLFRYFSKRVEDRERAAGADRVQMLESHAKDRQEWAVQRVHLEVHAKELRAEYEIKHREMIERHAESLRQLYDDAREHETLARREYAANMEVVAQKAREAQEKVGEVLDKIYNRYIGMRRRD